MTVKRVVTIAGHADAEARFATAIAARADAEIVFRCVDRVELLAAIRGASPDLIVAVGSTPWLDRQSCDEAVAARIPVVGMSCTPSDSDALANLGILVLPVDAELDRVLVAGFSGDALPRAPAALTRSLDRRGRLISVWGPKGAPGRSTVAVEIAAELAATESATALVDADTYGGDVAQMLGVVEELPSIVWACQTAASGDLDHRSLMRGLRRVGASGPVLVPGITRADLWGDVGEFAWRELLVALRAELAHCVVDVGFCLEEETSSYSVGEGRNATARAAVRDSDFVVAVCRADAVGLKSFLWAYQGLVDLVDEDRIHVVANRVTPGEEASIAELLRRHAGKRPVAYLPEDAPLFRAAVSKGVAARDIGPGSATCRAIRDVVAGLGGKPRPAGVFARLAGRA
ncbi:MAG: P-loop NTPase [Actinomycetota bacterium]|nr:P-loop NTPase [Actinomycetota bacterium]